MIETERLNLIPFTREHYDAILQNDNVSLGKLLDVETPGSWTEFKDARDAVPALTFTGPKASQGPSSTVFPTAGLSRP